MFHRHVYHHLHRLPSLEYLECRRLLTVDLNGDGHVGFADFLILADNYGEVAPGFGEGADIDGDGMVGFGDFTILADSYGADVLEFQSIGSSPPTNLEPTNPDPFEAIVRSDDQWHALTLRANPDSSPIPVPVDLDQSTLVFASLGETNLGVWAEVSWVTAGPSRIEVAYRVFIGGPAPPPGSHVAFVLISLPASDLPVHFVELATIPFP